MKLLPIASRLFVQVTGLVTIIKYSSKHFLCCVVIHIYVLLFICYYKCKFLTKSDYFSVFPSLDEK